MYKRLILALTVALLFVLVGIAVSSAQSPNVIKFKTEEEYRAWAQSIEDEIAQETGYTKAAVAVNDLAENYLATTGSCDHQIFQRDESTAGPLGQNSQVAVVASNFCGKTNTALIDVGSDWWGYQNKTQRVWGGVFIRDEFMVLVEILAFDLSNVPDNEGQALTIPMEWQAPWDAKKYQFDAEVNVRMLPENVGPDTLKQTWYFTTGQIHVYLPIIGKEGQCDGYQIKMSPAGRPDEFWPFKVGGDTVARIHFNHSQQVTFTWVDKDGNAVTDLPGDSQLIRLTWSDGYKDYPLNTTLTLAATNWRSQGGPPPWLATEHDVNYQFTQGSMTCRTTIPTIWDP